MATILSISSSVTTGHVGNSATVFALQRLGHEVWPLTTVALPHHPGHGAIPESARLVTPPETLTANLAELEARGWLSEIDAISVGYMATAAQTEHVAGWIDAIRSRIPRCLVMIDPILGDGDALYVRTDVAEAARDLLVPLADILKPNGFELSWLSGHELGTVADTLAAAAEIGRPETVVTSVPAISGRAANLALAAGGAHLTETCWFPEVPKGTGDLFGALYLGARLSAEPVSEALVRATAGVHAVLAESRRLGSRELALVAAQHRLSGETASVSLTSLPAGPPARSGSAAG